MTKNEVKEILERQLQLLSEESTTTKGNELAEMSQEVANLAQVLLVWFLEDNAIQHYTGPITADGAFGSGKGAVFSIE